MNRAPRVLWLSKHEPLPAQHRELERILPGCVIDQKVNSFLDAGEIVRQVRENGYDDVVVVAPLSVLDHLCRLGLRPLRAEMDQVSTAGPFDPDRDVNIPGRKPRRMRFREFRRVTRLLLETEPVTPSAG